MAGAFDGIRVVDLGRGIAAPYAAMLLAEQGADVLRVEPPGRDRLYGSPAYTVVNRSKRLAIIDLDDEAGRLAVRALAADADLVLVDRPAPEATRLGLDWPALSAGRDDLIYLAMPPYGAAGPLAGLHEDDALVAARSGITGGQWSGSDQPVDLVIPVTGYGAALLAAGAAGAALYARARDGLGQRVEVSQLAGSLAMQTGSLLRGPGVERLSGSAGDPLGVVPVYRLYQAGDGGWLFIAAGTPRFYQRLCLLLDHPEWISDERWANAPWGILDPADREALAHEIAPLIRGKPRDEWLRLLAEADIPAAPVETRETFIAHPQTAALGLRVEIDDGEVGRTVQMGTPVRLHGTPGPAPAGLGLGAWGLDDQASPLRDPDRHPSRSAPAPAKPQAPSLNPAGAAGPLAGVRVLDLSGFIAGAYCPMTLADFGADVIKLESPEGDAFRAFGFGFLGWNRGKRGLAVETRHPEGRALVHELVRTADVVVENFRPGAAAKLGLDYETLAAINPRLIYSTATAFGSAGPDAGAPGFDPLLQARSGIMAAQGGMDAGRPPVYLTAAICDYAAALLSVAGICAALTARERTGAGQRVETTLVHSAMAAQAGEFVWYEGRPALPEGGVARTGAAATDRVYRAGDGWLRLALRDAASWSALAGALADEALTGVDGEQAIAAPADGALATAIGAALARRPLAAWLDRLGEAGVPVAPVVRPADLFADEQALAEGLIADHTHARWGPVRQSGILAKFERTPAAAERAAPLLGQHSREVLLEAGIAPARIDSLIDAGIVIQAVLDS